jgi:hypothetical protein
VQLFEILQDGFHTPLTEAQISELFQAGRLNRHTRCKPVGTSECKTIDELFPLLKYHTPWQPAYQSPDVGNEFGFRRAIVVGLGVATAAAVALVVYLYSQSHPADREIAEIDSIPSTNRPLLVRQGPVASAQPIQASAPVLVTAPYFDNTPRQEVAVPVARSNPQMAIRLAEAKRMEEQARRDQAVAEQQRAREQELLEQQKASGRDHHVPLDDWQTIDVGGESVTLKIHDNDVTSFDVWMNYGVRREVKKEKGIPGSRTDETLIYSNGRAALYYVWEISGRINHCILRVRDA